MVAHIYKFLCLLIIKNYTKLIAPELLKDKEDIPPVYPMG